MFSLSTDSQDGCFEKAVQADEMFLLAWINLLARVLSTRQACDTTTFAHGYNSKTNQDLARKGKMRYNAKTTARNIRH